MRALILLSALSLATVRPAHSCDELISNSIKAYASPAFAELDCGIFGKAGLDKKGHTVNGVCYQSTGPTSHIRIDSTLNCSASGEGFVSKIVGGNNRPSASENVSVDADIKGSDCSVINLKISVSGAIGQAVADLFGADEKGGKALGDFLKQACKR